MTLFIVPGFKQKITDLAWLKVKKLAQKSFQQVTLFQPEWNYHTLTHWAGSFDQCRHQYVGPQMVLGFSFGAMIAFLSSINLPTKTAILCSLSPYFSEDISSLKPWWNQAVGKKRMAIFQETHFSKLAAKSHSQNYLLVGEKEVPQCFTRYHDALEQLSGSCGIVVPQAGHDIGHQAYLAALDQLFNKLS